MHLSTHFKPGLYDTLSKHDRESWNRMHHKLEAELTRLLYKQASLVGLSLYLLLGFVLYFFWDQIPLPLLLTWFSVSFFSTSLLHYLVWRFNRRPEKRAVKQWIDRYFYQVILQDLSWGMIGPLSFLAEDSLYQVLTLFMLAGMCAGAIAARGIIFKVYVAVIVSLLSPIIVTLALQSNSISHEMLLLTLIFIGFMLPVARNYSASVQKNILLWLDNEKLVAELTESQQKIKRTNKELVSEIDRRNEIEVELREAKVRAEKASEAKNQFLANVSHELRTPLNGIIGFSSLLEKANLAVEQEAYVGQIGRSANTLLNLVNDILDITSIEAGHLRLLAIPFEVRPELEEVLAVARTMATGKGLELSWEIRADVPALLVGDPNRLKQIVTNVLHNAVKYTDEGSVSMGVSVAESSTDGLILKLVVADTGPGIPAEAQGRLFENFTQVDSFAAKKKEGVGLGLAIVKNLLDKMEGSISLESAQGEGTTFTLILPFKTDAAASGADLSHQDRGAPGGLVRAEADLSRLRVLVVDDNEVNRMVLNAFLKQYGIQAKEAGSGEAALQMLQQECFDAALVDIQMPDVSGIDVAGRAATLGLAVPVFVAVTAHAFPEQRLEIINSGFMDCLVKPISEPELMAALKKVWQIKAPAVSAAPT